MSSKVKSKMLSKEASDFFDLYRKPQEDMNTEKIFWILVGCLLLLFLGNSEGSRAETFPDYLHTRERLQSPDGSEADAREFNYKLNRKASVFLDNGPYSEVGFAVLVGEESENFIKERCQQDNTTKQKCFEEFSGDPMAVLAIEQALATDDALKKDAEFYTKIGINDEQRQEYLENTYLAFKKSNFKEGGVSPKERIRERIKDLAGPNRLKELDDLAAGKDPKSALQAARDRMNTDVGRARDFTKSKFFPKGWEKTAQGALEKIEKADAAVKTGIRDIAATNLEFFTNAENASKFAKQVATFLGAESKVLKDITTIAESAEKGKKAFGALMTLGRASAGDITAYANAAGAIASLFGNDGGGGPSPVIEALNEVLQNQKEMIQRLDFIIAQLDRVSNHLVDIHRDIVIIDQNLRLVLEGQQELLSKEFRVSCRGNSEKISKDGEVAKAIEAHRFDPYAYPYDLGVYQKIVDKGVRLRQENGFVTNCSIGIQGLFNGMNLGPSAIFLLEKTDGSQNLEQYNHKVVEFMAAYKTAFPNDAISKMGEIELRVLASVPATRLGAVDEKVSKIKGKTYAFGANDNHTLEPFLRKSYDPYRTSVFQKHLYETLPYVWIRVTPPSDCNKNSCEGLVNFESVTHINALLDSLHFNLFVSANEALLQGDVLLPMLHKAVTVGGHEDLRNDAYRILSVNNVLRENYLRYLLYRSYQGHTRAAYRSHYAFLNDLTILKTYFGPTWNFERKAIDSQKFPKSNEMSIQMPLHIKMPCVEKLEDTKWLECSYSLPTPDTFMSDEYKHSLATKELARARAQGNKLLSVIQAYHPEYDEIKKSGL